jgi:micrococcal nuclease
MSKKAKKRPFAMSRRKKDAIIVISLLLAAFFIWLDHSKLNNFFSYHSGLEDSNSLDTRKYQGGVFLVTKVVDGDTIDINVSDSGKDYTRIRLWGVDTPETKDPQEGVCFFGPEASDFTGRLSLGKNVTIFLDKRRTRDKYDRLLAYVLLPDKRYLNEVLIEDGFGYADWRFRHDFYNKYKQLESSAKRNKKGLWKEVTFDKMPAWRQRMESETAKKGKNTAQEN